MISPVTKQASSYRGKAMANMYGAQLLPLPSSSLEDNDRSSRNNQNPKRKLEDYLDPVLLHTISARINRTKTMTNEKQIEKKAVIVNTTTQRSEFDWPVDLLDPLINDPNRDDTAEENDGTRLFAPSKRDIPMIGGW